MDNCVDLQCLLEQEIHVSNSLNVQMFYELLNQMLKCNNLLLYKMNFPKTNSKLLNFIQITSLFHLNLLEIFLDQLYPKSK